MQSVQAAIQERGDTLVFLNLVTKKGKRAKKDEGTRAILRQVVGLDSALAEWRKGEMGKDYEMGDVIVGYYPLTPQAQAATGRAGATIAVLSMLVREKKGVYDTGALKHAFEAGPHRCPENKKGSIPPPARYRGKDCNGRGGGGFRE